MLGDYDRGQIARKLLQVREARRCGFPSEMFDEYAWNMLLHLFVAGTENEVMSEQKLIKVSGASLSVGRRWLGYLLADGLITDWGDGKDVSFTATSAARMRLFLDQALKIHGGFASSA